MLGFARFWYIRAGQGAECERASAAPKDTLSERYDVLRSGYSPGMILLGVLLLILGLLLFHPLFIIGVILLVVGIVYEVVGTRGGRRRLW